MAWWACQSGSAGRAAKSPMKSIRHSRTGDPRCGAPGEQPARAGIQPLGQIPDDQASYTVRVHMDVDGDGRVSRGDYLRMESVPVLTHGYPNRVTVRAREVQ
jgi:hypothetical protein